RRHPPSLPPDAEGPLTSRLGRRGGHSRRQRGKTQHEKPTQTRTSSLWLLLPNAISCMNRATVFTDLAGVMTSERAVNRRRQSGTLLAPTHTGPVDQVRHGPRQDASVA